MTGGHDSLEEEVSVFNKEEASGDREEDVDNEIEFPLIRLAITYVPTEGT